MLQSSFFNYFLGVLCFVSLLALAEDKSNSKKRKNNQHSKDKLLESSLKQNKDEEEKLKQTNKQVEEEERKIHQDDEEEKEEEEEESEEYESEEESDAEENERENFSIKRLEGIEQSFLSDNVRLSRRALFFKESNSEIPKSPTELLQRARSEETYSTGERKLFVYSKEYANLQELKKFKEQIEFWKQECQRRELQFKAESRLRFEAEEMYRLQKEEYEKQIEQWKQKYEQATRRANYLSERVHALECQQKLTNGQHKPGNGILSFNNEETSIIHS